MGIISSLFNKFIEIRSYKIGKGIARAMFISALAMKEHYKDSAPSYAFIAGKALDTRPKWKRIDVVTFEYEPSGNQIKISDKQSIKDVIHMIVDVETEYIFNALPFERIEELTELSNKAVDDYLSKQNCKFIIERVDDVGCSHKTVEEMIAVIERMRDIEATRLVQELSALADTLPKKKKPKEKKPSGSEAAM